MMRFIDGYEKFERKRDMEYSLLLTLTIEIIVTITGYYTNKTEQSMEVVTELFHLFWILNLIVAAFFIIVSDPISYGQMITSVFVVGFCLLEFLYLVNGLSREQMTYPGKWITVATKKWNNDASEDVETARAVQFEKDISENSEEDVAIQNSKIQNSEDSEDEDYKTDGHQTDAESIFDYFSASEGDLRIL
ncbi:Protein CBG23672 [Caenorhabditis briggsae]|uniref:Protein CBG23672 n=1 Tax=Caenorhabditis briggsae TaxID=6238 RepID=A8WJ23_CAEBR|nr:Protein CBG23672 [Caenorhabditis briggsae]CAP20467.2 Protein CBG23672 [Caenorhabditis briggsae]